MIDRDEVRAALTGPISSLTTPFTRDGAVDHDALRTLIDANLAGGSRTALLTWGDSLFSVLTDDEVAAVTATVADHARGRALTVAADSDWWTGKSVEFARYCREIGIDLLMVKPPVWSPPGTAEFVEHYRAVAREIPVMLVTNVWAGTPDVALSVVAELLDRVDGVMALKDDGGGRARAQADRHGRRALGRVRRRPEAEPPRSRPLWGGRLHVHVRELPAGSDAPLLERDLRRRLDRRGAGRGARRLAAVRLPDAPSRRLRRRHARPAGDLRRRAAVAPAAPGQSGRCGGRAAGRLLPRARLEIAGVVLPTVSSSVYYLVSEPDGLAGKFPIQAFWTKYAPLRESARSAGPDEKIALTHAGLRRLGRAPAIGVQLGSPPQIRTESTNRYLWVIDDTGIPYVRELPIYALHGKLPKHTNLTGGGLAYIGGELWFSDDSCLFLSGGSGRYPPRNAEHLGDAVRVFEFYGYGVTSLGWDTDNDTAQRAFMK